MRRALFPVLAAVLLAALPTTHDKDAVGAQAGAGPAPSDAPVALVTSRDASRAQPSFVWLAPSTSATPKGTPEARARYLIEKLAPIYGLSKHALATAQVARVLDTGRGGIVVTFVQKVGGISVYGTKMAVLLDRQGRGIAISGALHPNATPGALGKLPEYRLDAVAATAAALGDHLGEKLDAATLEAAGRKNDDQLVELGVAVGGRRLVGAAHVHPVLFPVGRTLVPAWYVEALARQTGKFDDARGTVVAADDGRVLARKKLSYQESFKYRVWADTSGNFTPMDGPQVDYTPHPTGVPDGSSPAFVAPSLITMEGFNHNPQGMADPWLPAGATVSTGNNVEAYTDHDNSDDATGANDVRATTTSPNTFDHTYDTALAPESSANQEMAAVTQIFYVTNWLHDWWYDSGFTEATQNAQTDNFGRGGLPGDPLLAEGQDAADQGQRDNANMDAMSDGSSPRMQMYLWSGAEDLTLNLSSGGSVAASSASFGPANFNLTGTIALVDDGTAPATDACSAITNNITGKVALIDRGSCTFVSKVQAAQNAGAVAAIIINNTGTSPPQFGGNGTVNIPVLGMSLPDGNALKTALASGTVTVTMARATQVERDGTIDNTVVAHEWGHYLHLRQVDCGNAQCGGMSEGWGDFNALLMVVRAGDNYHGVFPLATYAGASFGDSYYFGIRRFPYSTDMTKDPLTFIDICDNTTLPTTAPSSGAGAGQNSESHNTGEIWASMLFEAYVALLDDNARLTFDMAHRRMTDYAEIGLQMAPPSPTFTEQRDAILAGAAAADKKDFALMAQGFARRGAGTAAISPARDSSDQCGLTESFTAGADERVVDGKIDDAAATCDADQVLDVGETGDVVLRVQNSGSDTLTGTTVSVSSTTPGVSFPDGTMVTLGDILPFDVAPVAIHVKLDTSFTGDTVAIAYEVKNPAAATPDITGTITVKANYDVKQNASATDDVESDMSVWTPADPTVWARESEASGNHLWHGVDPGGQADVALESPALMVGSTGNLKVHFSHHFKFEQSVGTNWDGGVIEISTDGGATWNDVTMYGATPTYGGALGNQSGNPLAGRQAYVGQNASYPNPDTETLDLGATFAGSTVKVRFRIGADQAQGDEGWFIDDIGFDGITNTPFPMTVPNAGGPCNPAGPDAGPGGDAGNSATGDGGGCGCRAGGDAGGAPVAGLALALVGLVIVRRRRRG